MGLWPPTEDCLLVTQIFLRFMRAIATCCSCITQALQRAASTQLCDLQIQCKRVCLQLSQMQLCMLWSCGDRSFGQWSITNFIPYISLKPNSIRMCCILYLVSQSCDEHLVLGATCIPSSLTACLQHNTI